MFDVAVQTYGYEIAYTATALVLAFVAVFVWHLFLDHRNAKGNSHFSRNFRAMQNDPAALAVYLRGRVIGSCICAGLIAAALLLRGV